MRVALLVAATALCACGGPGPDVDARNASVEEVAEQVRNATDEPGFIRPGKWLSQVTVEEVSAPSLPPQLREQMKGLIADRQSHEACLAPDQANRPGEGFFTGNDQCRYEHFRMGDGKIDARMRCSQSGVTQVMDLDGTYSPDAYQLRMETQTEFAGGPPQGMSMRMRVDSRRVGECEAKQA